MCSRVFRLYEVTPRFIALLKYKRKLRVLVVSGCGLSALIRQAPLWPLNSVSSWACVFQKAVGPDAEVDTPRLFVDRAPAPNSVELNGTEAIHEL